MHRHGPGLATTANGKTRKYPVCYSNANWKTYHLSDPLPVWGSNKIDISDGYLKKLLVLNKLSFEFKIKRKSMRQLKLLL